MINLFKRWFKSTPKPIVIREDKIITFDVVEEATGKVLFENYPWRGANCLKTMVRQKTIVTAHAKRVPNDNNN